MGINLPYKPLESVFNDTMRREGRPITAYTSGSEFMAFMRRNDDGNNYEDRITLFYPINAPVVQGSLISYGNKIYILVNRETEENHCYYKSSAIACNGMITLNDGSLSGIPCYAFDMKDSLIQGNNVISLLDGNMEFITESNSLSQQIDINDKFNEFGRTFQVDNIYYKDGLLHIIAQVTTNETPIENLSIYIDGLTEPSYEVGDTVQLTATLYVNNVLTSGTITWESTNTSVATIDGTGHVEFIGIGQVAFKAYWVEKNTENTTNSVGVGKSDVYIVEISGSDIKVGFWRTFTATLKDSSGQEQEGTWEWSFNFAYPNEVETKPSGNEIKVLVNDKNMDVVGNMFTITVHETTHDITESKTVMVIEGW